MALEPSTLRSPAPRSLPRVLTWTVGGAVGVAAAVEVGVLSGATGWLHSLDGWFYFPMSRPLGPWSAWVVLLAAALALSRALSSPRGRLRSPAARLFLLVAAGVGMMVGFALIEDRGMFALRDRILLTGHAEFARTATSGVPVDDVLRHYEERVASGTFGYFAKTKPPGTLLFYVLTERVAHALLPFPESNERLDWLATVATFAWPWVSMLSLVPLFVLGRAVADVERALWACALSVVVPSFLLITLHTDQVIFPLALTSAAACAAVAAARDNFRLALLAGALYYAAIFCSFGMFAAALVFGSCIVAGAVAYPSRRRQWLVTTARTAAGAALGFAVGAGAARWSWGYDMLRRFQVATAAHRATRDWKGTQYEITHFAFLNTLEFVMWLGAPIAVLAVAGAALGLVDTVRSRHPQALVVATSLVATIVWLAYFGYTKSETARLWLFLVQPACLAASLAIHRLFPDRGRLLLSAVLCAQFLIGLDFKRFQDFH